MTRAEEWRQRARELAQSQAVELLLPSGTRVLARRPGPQEFARWDKLPMGLASAAISGNGAGAPDSASVQEFEELRRFYAQVLEWCLVDPRISANPESPEEIKAAEIPLEDWTFLLGWALRVEEGRALETFRGQRADAGAGGDGQDVRAAAVEPGGDRGPGFSAGL